MNDSKKSSFWSDGLCIVETKVSSLILLLISFSVIAIYMFAVKEDITHNHMVIIQTLIAAVAGVNIANFVTGKKDDNTEPDWHKRGGDSHIEPDWKNYPTTRSHDI